MYDHTQTNPLLEGEEMIPLGKARTCFGGVRLSLSTINRYIHKGLRGVKLESVLLNKRYTSREAIKRFIARTQVSAIEGSEPMQEQSKGLPKDVIQKGIERHGL